jgi:GNAT superfamily N-acetyltransferase
MTGVTDLPDPPVLEFFDEPGAFLRAAGELLRAEPVLTTVVATVSQRALAGRIGPTSYPRWWVTVTEGGRVTAVGMRTAPGAPSPPYLTDMSPVAARTLAAALLERGEVLTAVNGAVGAARGVAEAVARATGGEVRVAEHTRLHELGTLVPAAAVPGRLRSARPDDVVLCLQWWEQFEVDAAAQAGRPPTGLLEPQDEGLMLSRIEQGLVWLWEDAAGRVVHLTADNPPAFGVVRVGPVFTPAQERGRGYGAAGVAAVSARAQQAGHRVCLFTDQANPVSNRLYAGLGYVPVVDTVQLEVTTPAPA